MKKIRVFLKSSNFTKPFLLITLITLSIILCFANLDNPPLEQWDEYTNSKVVYDTVESRHVLTLQMDGQPFFEKPPLWYWITMFATQISGVSNFSLRLVSAVSGLLLILLTFYLGWKMFSYKAGIIASFTLCATRQLFLSHPTIFATHTLRSADLDALQILFVMLSSLAFFNLTRSTHNKRGFFWLITASLFSSFAFLTKGPFALLPAIVYFCFQVINRGKATPSQIFKQFLIFNFSFLLVTVPWHLYIYLNFGKEFLNSYLGYHVLQRGMTTLEGHNEGLLFYIQLLFHKGFFFSGEILIIAVGYLITRYQLRIVKDFPLFHGLTATLLILFIITLVQTKLSWYLLPLYPFAALVIGKMFNDLSGNKRTWIRSITVFIFLLALSLQILINLKLILNL